LQNDIVKNFDKFKLSIMSMNNFKMSLIITKRRENLIKFDKSTKSIKRNIVRYIIL